MAPTKPHNFRLPADVTAALDALAAGNNSDATAEFKAALRDRIDAKQAGEELPPADRPAAEHRGFRLDGELWEALSALAAENGTSATDEAIAAIRARAATAREVTGKPKARRASTPTHAPQADPPAVIFTPPPLGLSADEDCPHPPAVRQKKGTYCPRCGTGGLTAKG